MTYDDDLKAEIYHIREALDRILEILDKPKQ